MKLNIPKIYGTIARVKSAIAIYSINLELAQQTRPILVDPPQIAPRLNGLLDLAASIFTKAITIRTMASVVLAVARIG